MVEYVSANQQAKFESQMLNAMKTPCTLWRPTPVDGALGRTITFNQVGGTLYCMAIAGQRRNDEQWHMGSESIQSTVYWHVAFPKGTDLRTTDELRFTNDIGGTTKLQILGALEPMTFQFADWVLCLEIT